MNQDYYKENTYKECFLRCVIIVLIIVLLFRLDKQKYRSSDQCTVKQMPANTCSMVPVLSNFSQPQTSNYNLALDRKTKQRKKHYPENDIMKKHTMGKTLDNAQQKIDDPISLDGLLQQKHLETTSTQLNRSFGIGNEDGPELEGMSAPIDQFERNAMNRQLNKHQEVYGFQHHKLSDADKLSELNI